jgi:hypothetical protein
LRQRIANAKAVNIKDNAEALAKRLLRHRQAATRFSQIHSFGNVKGALDLNSDIADRAFAPAP